MKPLFLALFLCFFIEKSQSQQAIEDIDRDLDKFNSLILSKPPEAHFFLKRAIKKSENINSDSLQSKVLCNLGYYYYQTNQSDSSKNVFERSLLLSKKVKYYRMLGYAYNQLGLIAVDKGDYQKAISLHLGALKIASAHHIAKMKSNALNNLGNVFLIQKDTVKALEYYHQNIINALENNLENQLTNGYMTIANLNIYSNPSKANIFYSKALILARKNKDLKTQLTIEICKTNMSLKSKKSLQKAYYHIQKSIAIENELKDASLLYYIDINLGDYYYYLKQYSLAEINYLKAENNFDKGVDLHIKLSLYNSLSKLYESKKDFEKSLSYKEKYRELNEKLFSIEKNKALNEIQTKYEVNNKNLKISLLTKDKQIQKNTKKTIIFVGVFLLVLLLTVVFYLRQRIKIQRLLSIKKQKIHQQEIVRLEQEKEIKRVNGVLEGQNQERNRLAKEIHDGIGGSLAGIKLQLSQENTSLKNENIEVVINQIGSAFNELRAISHNLSFNFLKDKNLENLVNQLKIDHESRDEFELDVVVFPENSLSNLSEFIKHNLYRIIQELITNVSKHASANKVLLSFTRHEKVLNIILEDNGVGFVNKKSGGIGFKNIQERIISLNATIVFDSLLHQGTTIIIDIPTYE